MLVSSTVAGWEAVRSTGLSSLYFSLLDLRPVSAGVSMVGLALLIENFASGVICVTSIRLSLGTDIAECASPSGINGLVGGVLEGTIWDDLVASDSNIVLFVVESGDGVGDACFSEVSTSLSCFPHSTDLSVLRRLESVESLGSRSRCSRRRRQRRDMVTTAMIAEDLLETGDKTCRFLTLVVQILSNAIAAYASADTGVVARTVFGL